MVLYFIIIFIFHRAIYLKCTHVGCIMAEYIQCADYIFMHSIFIVFIFVSVISFGFMFHVFQIDHYRYFTVVANGSVAFGFWRFSLVFFFSLVFGCHGGQEQLTNYEEGNPIIISFQFLIF